MTEPYRVMRLRQQIAHLKVLMNYQQERLIQAEKQREAQLAHWTKEVLVEESAVSTYRFRIEELETEIARLDQPLPIEKRLAEKRRRKS